MRLLPRSIRGRLTLWFLLIALLPTLAAFGALRLVVVQAVKRVVEQNLTLLRNLRADQIETFVEERDREVRYMARSPYVREALARLETLTAGAGEDEWAKLRAEIRRPLQEFYDTLHYPGVYFFDADGRKLVQVGEGIDPGAELFAGPLRDTPFAAGVRSAVTDRTGVVTRPFVYRTTGRETIALFSVHPVLDDSGKAKGAVVAEIAPEELFTFLTDYAGLGETGEAYLTQLSGNDVRIVSPLRNDTGQSFATRSYPVDGEVAFAASAAARKFEGYGLRTDYRGESVVAAWTYLPSLGLGLVVEVDEDDAYSWLTVLRWASIGLFGLIGLLVIPFAFVVARTFTQPIVEASKVAQRVASGDLATVAEGRLATGEVGELQQGLRSMTGQLRGLIGQVQHSIVTVMSASAQIAATARQQQQTVDDFGISTTEVAAAVNEISATSQELLHTMGEVTASAQRSAELAVVGQESLGGMHKTMNRLADSTGSISSRLSVISERANNINLAVTTITKVADQTNLLSINAAIEAEKAGEHGRGFIVVAREIRRLADQTAAATLDIERIVKEMQQSVSAGVMEMDKFNEQVRQGVGEVGTIGEQLHEIIHSVQDVLPRFEQVSEGMTAQSQGAEQIREAMGQLRDGASHTAASLGEFQQTTEQLRDSIGRLQTDIARFQT